ncbi:entericidin A/B family lipoprotein [Bordetella bronchiseptica]|nr:entericidin A/B family lipoprotein [Bordetella bronchiseptica]KDD17861.1 entericidin EcnA/B family protein [Bordetella bronchiseptica MBORD707]
MNNRIRAALLVAITLVALAGCNTMSGAGKDIERGGEKIQEKAQ